MKINELILDIFGGTYPWKEGTVDTVKIGDTDREVSLVATCFIATPEVIRAAAAMGAQFIITHEPTVHDHMDVLPTDKAVSNRKLEMLRETGITLMRYHDHPHFGIPGVDLFGDGFAEALGLEGEMEDVLHYCLKEKITAAELGRLIKERLGADNARLAGDADTPSNRIALLLGFRGGEWWDFLQSDDCHIAIAGEVSEWQFCEYARDSSELGIPKSIITLGHGVSERDGVKYITKLWSDRYSQRGIEFRYIECGDVYTAL